jgi:hypothetical protein
LLFSSNAKLIQPGAELAIPDDLLLDFVDGQFAGGIEINLNAVRLIVDRLRRPGDIGDGLGDHFQVAGNQRREECEREADAGGFELISGARGGDVEGGLLHRLRRVGAGTHKAPGFAVDADLAAEGVDLAGPVAWPVGIQLVADGPDGEVGIVGDEGHSGRAEGSGLISRVNGRDQCEKKQRKKTDLVFNQHDMIPVGRRKT